ncbi:MAG: CotH kinase family protein [Acidobacteria bacterium]|nr:CotH kinase family protein [Acidobacteriota bacterium]
MRPFLILLCSSLLPGQVVTPPASAVFDPDVVHEIRLTFQQPDWYEQLTDIYAKYPDNTPYIEASIEWGSNKFDTIGVRFKGNSSYNGATTKKKPFRLKLNEFVKGQKIDGMASFGLNNLWNDPSFVREKPYYELSAAAGLPSPRSSFAALYVNGEYWGLYGLTEIVNGDFLKSHFAKGDDGGNLYKASDPGANLAYLGEDPTAYQRFFSKESNEDANDWSDLIELARLFDQTPAAELPAKIKDLVDVDSFLTALALDNLTVNLDSYVGMSQNYFLYRRPSDKKWVWIPWDPSLAFGALAQGVTAQQMRDLPLEWTQSANTGGGGFPGGGGAFPPGGGLPPGGGGNIPGFGSATRPIATKLWGNEEYKKRYREIYNKLLNEVFLKANVTDRMNTLREIIRPYVELDTQKLTTMAAFDAAMTVDNAAPVNVGVPGRGDAGGLGSAPALQPFIEARTLSVKAQLAGQASPVVTATPASIETALISTAAAPAQNVVLALPEGSPSTTFTATSSAPWLTLSGATGGFPGRLGVALDPQSLAPGSYSATVTVVAPGTTSNPLRIPVTLAVSSQPALIASPANVMITPLVIPGGGGFPGGGGGGGFPGGGGPGGVFAGFGQSIRVLSTGGASPFTVTITDSTCGNFLTATPTQGTTPASVTLSVAANTTGTNCTAKVNLASPNLATATVTVTLGQQP